MAINKKLIHFKNKQNFETEVANGNILDSSIVFIQDSREIYTHGTYYGSTINPSGYLTISVADSKYLTINDAINTYLTISDANNTFQPKGNYITNIPIANSTTEGAVLSGGDVTIDNGIITVKDGSHNHIISNVDGLQDILDSKQEIISDLTTIRSGAALGATALQSVPTASTSTAGIIKVGSNISISSGTISLSKDNITDALGYIPPTSNTTYSEMTAAEATTGTATTARSITAKVLHDKITEMLPNTLQEAKSYTNTKISELVGQAPEALDTVYELAEAMQSNQGAVDALEAAIGNKVDKVSGKGLSTNDYTTTEKNKLAEIASKAEVNQNAFSNITIGETTITADSKTDNITIVAGSNITLTPDATNDKITIAAKDTTYSFTNKAATLAWNSAVTVATVGGTDITVKLPANPNSDTNVNQTVTTTNANYPLLLAPSGQTATTTTTSYFSTGIYANASTKSVYATHFYETSDRQFKTNIESILSSDNCPKIRQFNWKENGSRSYGFIAQELEEQGYEELVDTNEENGSKTVNYSAALSLVVGKMQVKIEELEKKILELEDKLANKN